jgi:hypothetical protein
MLSRHVYGDGLLEKMLGKTGIQRCDPLAGYVAGGSVGAVHTGRAQRGFGLAGVAL